MVSQKSIVPCGEHKRRAAHRVPRSAQVRNVDNVSAQLSRQLGLELPESESLQGRREKCFVLTLKSFSSPSAETMSI